MHTSNNLRLSKNISLFLKICAITLIGFLMLYFSLEFGYRLFFGYYQCGVLNNPSCFPQLLFIGSGGMLLWIFFMSFMLKASGINHAPTVIGLSVVSLMVTSLLVLRILYEFNIDVTGWLSGYFFSLLLFLTFSALIYFFHIRFSRKS